MFVAAASGTEWTGCEVSAVVVKSIELIGEYFLTLDDGTGQLKARCPGTLFILGGQRGGHGQCNDRCGP